jgi:tetratricopeptide (TPR) repeat protein
MEEHALKLIAVNLTEVGETDQALDVAGLIESATQKGRALADVANVLAVRGEKARAIEVAGRALEVGGQEVSIRAVVGRALARAGEQERALATVDEALALGQSNPSAAPDPWSLTLIASTYAAIGKVEEATALVAPLNEAAKAYALREIAISLAEAGSIDQAVEIAGSIEDPGTKSPALAQVARSLASK